ncbi:MAG TPA: valine--tRNA ligase [Flavobacteriales bacterium]|jgi:valyl-tRNA synthetase|nr:valine--tRNA ligase [Flavobacteriales bacterium]
MEIPSRYSASGVESKWYQHWLSKNYFHSEPDDREPFTILIPPPNVTGVLHMGHMLNNTIQDVLIRKARMEGKNALWVPGTDHASIATEAKVVAMLKAKGIDKSDLSRDEFLEHAWDWTHKHGGIIIDQLKRLGASCDWERLVFTMDETRNASVKKVFLDLYDKGLIYRGIRMVNWDPEAQTTVSDEEVIHKEISGKLYYLKYKLTKSNEYLTVATTRPETVFGDTAVCVNPEDSRYKKFIGETVIVPAAGREVRVISDDYVDPEFGTGILKITPAHDVNDYEIGKKHHLEFIDSINDDGKLNHHGMQYEGMDRFEVRKKIVSELEEKDLLLKAEDYVNKVGTSERTGSVIEPKMSVQWFLNMKNLAKLALDAVDNNEVSLIPTKFGNSYRHWLENVRDWNISRQLYWGHEIPAWYYGDGIDDYVVAENEDDALNKTIQVTGNKLLEISDLRKDQDTLDTWFSSWLWPISVFDGIINPGNPEIEYYYPTNVLVTAPDIIFFWVARMIMAGYEYLEKRPFHHVYFTGMVRDKKGRKMSKSLGNSPDPIKLMDEYGADAVRAGMLLTAPAGNDIPFDVALCEQGRNFANKIWNAMRLVRGWEVVEKEQTEAAFMANKWMNARLNSELELLEESFKRFRLSEALMSLYKLIWDDFCGYYLELIKPDGGKEIDAGTYEQAISFFEELMIMLHPFMPFLTEEMWHVLRDRAEGDDIIIGKWPKRKEAVDEHLLNDFKHASKVIGEIRGLRSKEGLSPKKDLKVSYKGVGHPEQMDVVVEKLANTSSIQVSNEKPAQSVEILVGHVHYFVELDKEIDAEAELSKMKEELSYHEGFLNSVMKKLSNQRFVNNAPEKVVEIERKKKEDAERKIEMLQERISLLTKK